jgi:hypothetical protein
MQVSSELFQAKRSLRRDSSDKFSLCSVIRNYLIFESTVVIIYMSHTFNMKFCAFYLHSVSVRFVRFTELTNVS